MDDVRVMFPVGLHSIALDFNRKPEQFGTVAFEQWWLPIRSLYGETSTSEATSEGNSRGLLKAYWQICNEHGTQPDPEVCESYLLVHFGSNMRTVGSRRIFADGFLGCRARGVEVESGQTLDESIRLVASQSCSLDDFHQQTRAILGRWELPEESREEYTKLCDELFSSARAHRPWNEAAAIEKFERTWKLWEEKYGRRKGHEHRKLAMDMLSYEARAAFHRAYSAVWVYVILPKLREQYGLERNAAEFHEFWHTDPSWELSEQENYFLFHGHVFGLHPAGAAFLQCEAGRELVGNWLECRQRMGAVRGSDERLWTGVPGAPGVDLKTTSEEQVHFGRLLNGLLISVCDYSSTRSEIAARRRPTNRPDISDRRGRGVQGQVGLRTTSEASDESTED